MTTNALLTCRGLSASVDEKPILHEVDLDVVQGEVHVLMGPNGAGKSTLGHVLMGDPVYELTQGSITFDGEDITSLSTSQLSRRGISIMQQGGEVFQNLSVWDNLQLASGNSQLSTLNSQLCGIVPLLQHPKRELQNLMADKLSGGQKHQLSLAMTLATYPELVILDEPSAGLSPIAVEEMYQMLRAIKEKLGITIILIEQNIAKAVEFCDRSLMMGQGAIIKEFRNEEITEIENRMFNNKN